MLFANAEPRLQLQVICYLYYGGNANCVVDVVMISCMLHFINCHKILFSFQFLLYIKETRHLM